MQYTCLKSLRTSGLADMPIKHHLKATKTTKAFSTPAALSQPMSTADFPSHYLHIYHLVPSALRLKSQCHPILRLFWHFRTPTNISHMTKTHKPTCRQLCQQVIWNVVPRDARLHTDPLSCGLCNEAVTLFSSCDPCVAVPCSCTASASRLTLVRFSKLS